MPIELISKCIETAAGQSSSCLHCGSFEKDGLDQVRIGMGDLILHLADNACKRPIVCIAGVCLKMLSATLKVTLKLLDLRVTTLRMPAVDRKVENPHQIP